jgi:hypothetical protein
VRSGRFSAAAVRWKFEHTYDRIKVPHARAIARPLANDAVTKLAALERHLAASGAPLSGSGEPAVSVRQDEV